MRHYAGILDTLSVVSQNKLSGFRSDDVNDLVLHLHGCSGRHCTSQQK